MPSLSDRICAHVAGLRFDQLPPFTVSAARRVLLDASGVMLGASGLASEPAPFIRLAMAQGSGPCAILGTGQTSSAPLAALANGAMAHALDYEDAFDLVPGHPNASLVPALIALAQAEAAQGRPVSGQHFLTALAAGGDLSCRIAMALRQHMELGGWYPPPMIAAFGATAGAARLLGLDAVQVRDALSLTLCQAVMPGEIKYSERTVIRAVREAFPAQSAVLSALLAREGLAGFEAPLEGRAAFYALYAGGNFSETDLLDGLGTRFWIDRLTYKPWPTCRGTHPFIEMALDLRQRHGITPADIALITLGIDDVQHMLAEPAPRKQAPAVAIDAKFSIPFTAAMALVRGRAGLDDFDSAALHDADVLALAAKVSCVMTDAPPWQRGSGGTMRITLNDGRELDAAVHNALGCPDRPLDDARLTDKFVDCASRASRGMGRDDARALAGRIMELEACADVGALFS